jgi:hypothetical protein
MRCPRSLSVCGGFLSLPSSDTRIGPPSAGRRHQAWRAAGAVVCLSALCASTFAAAPSSGWTDDGTVVRLTTSSDDVGIGTDAPSEKLEVSGNVKADTLKGNKVKLGTYVLMSEKSYPNRLEVGTNFAVTLNTYLSGDLEVSGKIYADSVNVEAVIVKDWTIEAPDYVFEPDYKLRPLAEVERHVQTAKHLPDMPSGAELKKGGVDLGELNMALLKKVEELTLYAIAQEKRIAALESSLGTRSNTEAIEPATADRSK